VTETTKGPRRVVVGPGPEVTDDRLVPAIETEAASISDIWLTKGGAKTTDYDPGLEPWSLVPAEHGTTWRIVEFKSGHAPDDPHHRDACHPHGRSGGWCSPAPSRSCSRTQAPSSWRPATISCCAELSTPGSTPARNRPCWPSHWSTRTEPPDIAMAGTVTVVPAIAHPQL